MGDDEVLYGEGVLLSAVFKEVRDRSDCEGAQSYVESQTPWRNNNQQNKISTRSNKKNNKVNKDANRTDQK